MRALIVLLLLASPVWALRITDAIGPEMEVLESAENLSPEKYCSAQYQALACALGRQSEKIRVMSYNMLMNRREEKLTPPNYWHRRLARIVALIEKDQPDVIGTQELYEDQLDDLLNELSTTYAFFGRGSHDGQNDGEINGIFYRKDRFKPLTCRLFWLSATPNRPGPDHSVSFARTLTMVQLYDKATHQRFALFNTHLSFGSPNSRDESARHIAQITAQYAAEIPVIVMGDFNTFPNWPDRTLPFYDGPWIERILTSGCLQDAKRISVLGHIGPTSTYTNRGTDPTPFVGTGEPGVTLDHLYISGQICVLLHATEPAKVDGHYPSDHMPVIADLLVW